MRILIADDSQTQRAMLKLALEKENFEVIVAKDGIETVEKAYREQPDIIVSDIVMPELNGHQLCRLLKDDRSTSHIPIILLTSLDQKKDMFWGLKSGADEYIRKEKDGSGLVESIKLFIDAHKSEINKTRGKREALKKEVQSLNIMSKVINLLDMRLFESTVSNEIGELVNTMEDCEKTIKAFLEILSKVVDFYVASVCIRSPKKLDYQENPRLYMYVNKLVGNEHLEKMKEKVLRSLEINEKKKEIEVKIFDPHKYLSPKKKFNNSDFKSFYKVSLTMGGWTSGMISIASLDKNVFSEETVRIFYMISKQANIVINYARLYERNKMLSVTDGLTGIYNHRFFQDNLEKEFKKTQRYKTHLSLILLDIDYFKRVNDTYGHQLGDFVLIELAKIMKKQLRCIDFLARYGGEEFIIIMPETDGTKAVNIAKRLRRLVENHDFSHPGHNKHIKISISLGVAWFPSYEAKTPEDIIRLADNALYKAKSNGRNRVEMYDSQIKGQGVRKDN